MAKLEEIVSYLDDTLSVDVIPDYPQALNGLQVENKGEVNKVVAAVDASLSSIQKAVEVGADLMIVHHGLFWQGARCLVKADYEKYRLLFENNIAVYSAHIPLDIHAQYGNNVLLADALALKNQETFFEWRGIELGVSGEAGCTLRELVGRVREEVGEPISVCGDLEKEVGRVGVITGGAGSDVEKVCQQGIQTFVTGEGPHWSYPLAEELGLNVIYAGHYATEVFGVCELIKVLAERFNLEAEYLANPTFLQNNESVHD